MTEDARATFIAAAVGHGSLERAEAIRNAHPEVAGSDIHTAAILGDDGGVRRFLAADAGNATARAGPHGWDALTHLCFSRYLRLDRARSEAFVRAARALLDAGASASTGYFDSEHEPPEWEVVLYGAAGLAHHAELTRLLLERGADPKNDGAGVGNTAGVRHLLELGVDVNAPYQEDDGYWGIGKDSTALHVAAWRARHATLRLLVERGARVDVPDGQGRTPLALAVRACVDSYWTELRSPESVRTLLAGGASVKGVAYPSGYAEVDELLGPALG